MGKCDIDLPQCVGCGGPADYHTGEAATCYECDKAYHQGHDDMSNRINIDRFLGRVLGCEFYEVEEASDDRQRQA